MDSSITALEQPCFRVVASKRFSSLYFKFTHTSHSNHINSIYEVDRFCLCA